MERERENRRKIRGHRNVCACVKVLRSGKKYLGVYFWHTCRNTKYFAIHIPTQIVTDRHRHRHSHRHRHRHIQADTETSPDTNRQTQTDTDRHKIHRHRER